VTRSFLPPRCIVTSPTSSSFRFSRGAFLFAPLIAVFFLTLSAQAADPVASTFTLSMKTPGALMPVGGGRMSDAVRDKFLDLAGGKRSRLVVIPTASARADHPEVSPTYLYWRSQDVASVELMHTRSREQANNPTFVKPLESATGVWFTGGDQSRLTAAYSGTAVLRELKKVLERGGVIAGTSAGASVMSAVMISGGTTEAELSTGFGLAPSMVIDQHFTNRSRMGRLQGVLTRHPDQLGVGIDEQTAVVIQGSTMTAVGDAGVWVCLCASATERASLQRLKHGEHVDLLGLSQTLATRNRKPDNTTLTSASKTSEREPTTRKGESEPAAPKQVERDPVMLKQGP
jgi:cyanophycinase